MSVPWTPERRRPLAIDLFCGLGGWTEGLVAEGYRVVGFDIEQHVYGEARIFVNSMSDLFVQRLRPWVATRRATTRQPVRIRHPVNPKLRKASDPPMSRDPSLRDLIETHVRRAVLEAQHQNASYQPTPYEANALTNMRHILSEFAAALAVDPPALTRDEYLMTITVEEYAELARRFSNATGITLSTGTRTLNQGQIVFPATHAASAGANRCGGSEVQPRYKHIREDVVAFVAAFVPALSAQVDLPEDAATLLRDHAAALYDEEPQDQGTSPTPENRKPPVYYSADSPAPSEVPHAEALRVLHTRFNVILRRQGAVVPACDGPDCVVCAEMSRLAALAVPETP